MLPKKASIVTLALLGMACGCAQPPQQQAYWDPPSGEPVAAEPTTTYNYNKSGAGLIPTPPSVRTYPIPST